MARVPDFITKNRPGYRAPVPSRAYRYTPPVTAQSIKFEDPPDQPRGFSQFQYLLTNEEGILLASADGQYYLAPDRL